MTRVDAAAGQVQYHYLLDGLRFFAAAAVVVWHYQHFFYTSPGVLAAEYDVASSPFFSLLKPLYYFGGFAVELFFVLSGFIFFWLYRRRIFDRSVSTSRFFVLRFSRLYPLHFATLIIVCALQIAAFSLLGQFIVYPENDLKHFVLNLLFASHWGLQDGWSFNAPVWSVSVEILLYAGFFAIARRFRSAPACVAVGLLLGGALMYMYKTDIGWAFLCFFMGGSVHAVTSWLEGSKHRRNHRFFIVIVAGIGALISGYIALMTLPQYRESLLFLVSFPMATLSLAGMQILRPHMGVSIARLGDLSYAIYLLHFPLQLTIILCDQQFGLAIQFTNDLVFLLYFVTLLGLSFVVYRRFELPAQRGLRGLFLRI